MNYRPTIAAIIKKIPDDRLEAIVAFLGEHHGAIALPEIMREHKKTIKSLEKQNGKGTYVAPAEDAVEGE